MNNLLSNLVRIMMRVTRYSLLVGIIISAQLLFAQTDSVVDTATVFRTNYFNNFNHLRGDLFSGTAQQNMLSVKGSFLYASSHVTNPMAFDFYQRKHVDGADIQNSLKAINGINTTGNILNAGASVLMNLKGVQLTVGYEISNIQSLRYTEDLFKIVMIGNASYEDKVAKAGNFQYDKVVYDKINIGIIKRKNSAVNPLSYTAGISFVRGLQYDHLEAPQLDIYTAPDGEYLDFRVKSSFYENKEDKLKFSTVNGMGGALFGGVNLMLSGTASFSAQVSDIGFIAWNKDMTYYQADTSFKVEPLEVNGLFASGKTYQAFADSLKELIYGRPEQRSEVRMLPFNLSLNYKMQLNSKAYLDIMLVHYFNIPFRPMLSAGVLYFISSSVYIKPLLQIGGFSAFNLRVNSGFRISPRLEAEAGIFGLEALPVYGSRPGIGTNAAFHLNF